MYSSQYVHDATSCYSVEVNVWLFIGTFVCMFVFPELCEVLETEERSEGQMAGPVQYQCLDCLALFDSPETWLEHRRTHSRSSTHSNTETMLVRETYLPSLTNNCKTFVF